ncbi:TPA: type IV secretion system protein VirB3 [Legionella anisa]
MSHINEATLNHHPVYGALTRCAMTGGVTFEYHSINLMISVCVFIAMGNLLYGLVFLPLHAYGWLVCRNDTRYFTVMYKRWMFCPPMPNQKLWGVRTYEPV